MYNNYSLDMVKHQAFNLEKQNLDYKKEKTEEEKIVHNYLEKRLNEIDSKYKDF